MANFTISDSDLESIKDHVVVVTGTTLPLLFTKQTFTNTLQVHLRVLDLQLSSASFPTAQKFLLVM